MIDAPSAAHEREFVKAFVLSAKRERYCEGLARPRRRGRLLHELADPRALERLHMTPIPKGKQAVDQIEELLKQKGAPRKCYVLSEISSIDGTFMALEEALCEIVGAGLASVVSCLPGVLGFYEGEVIGERWLLERRGGPTTGCS